MGAEFQKRWPRNGGSNWGAKTGVSYIVSAIMVLVGSATQEYMYTSEKRPKVVTQGIRSKYSGIAVYGRKYGASTKKTGVHSGLIEQLDGS